MVWPWSSSSNDTKPRADAESLKENLKETIQEVINDSSSSISSNSKTRAATDWINTPNLFDWHRYTEARNVVPTIALTTLCLFTFTFYRSFLRRIPNAAWIPPNYLRRRSLLGKVTSVGDGDNFRMFHTPGGRLAGWGWLPLRRVPTEKEHLKDQTIHVRLAGVDAPEMPHFGRPAQPFSSEALSYLTTSLIHKRVRAHLHRADQYGRVVATVYVQRLFGLWRQDISLAMLKNGLATVYEAKSGAEFGGKKMEAKYRDAEAKAKRKGKGMWGVNGGKGESPREYKAKYAAEEAEKEREGKASRQQAGSEAGGKAWWKIW